MHYLKKTAIALSAALITSFILTSCSTAPRIPTPGVVQTIPTPSPADIHIIQETVYHSVAPGETLWRISKTYGVDIETLKHVNNIADVRNLEIGTRLYIPDAAPRRDVITLYPSRKWKYIIIHHSATDFGNSLQFNKAHMKRGWETVGYHFVIDNGTCGKADGQIETTPRWIKQMSGAHCKASGMNDKGIGICLVGNFSEGNVTSNQMDSLIVLVKKLKGFYHIPDSNIMGHGKVPGAKTECPGKNFPWKKFRSRLTR